MAEPPIFTPKTQQSLERTLETTRKAMQSVRENIVVLEMAKERDAQRIEQLTQALAASEEYGAALNAQLEEFAQQHQVREHGAAEARIEELEQACRQAEEHNAELEQLLAAALRQARDSDALLSETQTRLEEAERVLCEQQLPDPEQVNEYQLALEQLEQRAADSDIRARRAEQLLAEVGNHIREQTARNEQAMETLAERLTVMNDISSTAIIEVGNAALIVYMNQAGFDLFGCTQEDIEGGISFMAFLHPSTKAGATDHMIKTLYGKKPYTGEYRMVSTSGAEFAVKMKCAPLAHTGKTAALLVAVMKSGDSNSRIAPRLVEQHFHLAEPLTPEYVVSNLL